MAPLLSGFCKNDVRRYAYHSTSKSCKSFKYRGTGGNGNRFETHRECMSNCSR
ncbi:uncharacterized protein DEA37_0008684 [Paragonimus westermani]|uniref:BPTI/Kunitz inhibitor domain-containing protein n=1 Tax=Paragonimus westermani TaxID=34504 RepID=A0A5J4N997_9TREM|nr:uncharacterized protein DEA37_0002916 [Paragonimus westermani]KAA3672134.1 uncharacterized protein DEA37_0008684 [Paragonimus westermani]